MDHRPQALARHDRHHPRRGPYAAGRGHHRYRAYLLRTQPIQENWSLTSSSQAIPQITSDFHSLEDVGWYGGAYQLASYETLPQSPRLACSYTDFVQCCRPALVRKDIRFIPLQGTSNPLPLAPYVDHLLVGPPLLLRHLRAGLPRLCSSYLVLYAHRRPRRRWSGHCRRPERSHHHPGRIRAPTPET